VTLIYGLLCLACVVVGWLGRVVWSYRFAKPKPVDFDRLRARWESAQQEEPHRWMT
jgi:uncharacterized iron-regulated membrane protein